MESLTKQTTTKVPIIWLYKFWYLLKGFWSSKFSCSYYIRLYVSMQRQKRYIPYLQGVCIIEQTHIHTSNYGSLNTFLPIQSSKSADVYTASIHFYEAMYRICALNIKTWFYNFTLSGFSLKFFLSDPWQQNN